MLSLSSSWVWSLVRELWSHKLCICQKRKGRLDEDLVGSWESSYWDTPLQKGPAGSRGGVLWAFNLARSKKEHGDQTADLVHRQGRVRKLFFQSSLGKFSSIRFFFFFAAANNLTPTFFILPCWKNSTFLEEGSLSFWEVRNPAPLFSSLLPFS